MLLPKSGHMLNKIKIMKSIKLGLFGFGCVGKGFYEILQSNATYKNSIKTVVVKDQNKIRAIEASRLSYDKNDILLDEEIDIVVELIDNTDDAYFIVSEALKKGKKVITANKKMLANHLEELIQLEQTYGGILLYEAAVCGSIPIINILQHYYQEENLESIKGIFNGTTNYILTKVIKENLSYSSALQQAQSLGFAESDPTSDVEGFDPSYKAAIVAASAFGIFVKPDNIIRSGISGLQLLDIEYAKKNNWELKLQVQLQSKNGVVWLSVLPAFTNQTDPLANIAFENNTVVIQADYAKEQQFSGKGAGDFPTGSAVWSDLINIIDNKRYPYKKLKTNQNVLINPDGFIKVYVRSENGILDTSDLPWQELENHFKDKLDNYTIGYISLKQLKRIIKKYNSSIFVALLPDSEIKLNTAIKTKELETARF
jgi:homoserine dehydrogenase